jgi:inner membrane protein
MDPLTHGLVGAAAGQSFSNKETARYAAFSGAIAGMMADLDIFIHAPGNPLFNIEVHRQFTHSLIFIPFGALIAAGLLWLLLKKKLSFREIYLFSFAGYATSGILDSFTSYGTQLLWPFLETRFAWNLISVVDPIFTLGIILLVGAAIWQRQKVWLWVVWAWIALFLMFGAMQNSRATVAASQLAESRGHQPEQLVVKPTIGNQLLWRANYIYNDQIYTDAIRTGIFSGTKVYEGTSSPRVVIERDFSDYENTTLYSDLIRFKNLSENYLVRHPEQPDIIGDGRYSMLPTEMIPLWGVEADTSRTDEHLPFLYFRDASEEVRSCFLDMLLGRQIKK